MRRCVQVDPEAGIGTLAQLFKLELGLLLIPARFWSIVRRSRLWSERGRENLADVDGDLGPVYSEP
jgi:hypothetical protein